MNRSRSIIEIEDDEDASFDFREKKPRNIIFCIDVSIEMNEEVPPSFNTGLLRCSAYTSTRFETIQRLINKYIAMNKMIGNKDDKYGIMTLTNEATWWYDCSGDPESLKSELSILESQVTHRYDHLYTKSIFNVIHQNVFIDDDDYFTQAILFYGRTDVAPINLGRSKYDFIRDSPNFTLDVIFMHNQSPEVQLIYDTWNELDSTVNEGWYYEVGLIKCKDRLAKAMAELLAHPLQRASQEKCAMQHNIPISESR